MTQAVFFTTMIADRKHTSGDAAARDVMAIIKGMVDAAGVRGETDQRTLSIRVQRAVFGYLNTSL
jgi:hypothetical protein